MSNVISRLSLRRQVEQAGVVATKAPKAPKSPKTPKAPKGEKKTKTTETAPATPTADATPAPKKERGRKGKHGIPVYRAWTLVFVANGQAADGLRGEKNVLGWDAPKTDAEIAAWLKEEFNGRCAEARESRVSGVRSLYNRGVINKQDGVPSRLVGEIVEKDGKRVEMVKAARVVEIKA